MDKSSFVKCYNSVAKEVTEIADNKGWGDNINDAEKLLLMHTEISEAVESLRHNDPASEHIPNFTGVEEEMADLIIRVMHYGYAKHLNIGEAIAEKIKFNKNRSYKHGGKKF